MLSPVSNSIKSCFWVHSWPQGKAGTVRQSQAYSSDTEKDGPRRGRSEHLIK